MSDFGNPVETTTTSRLGKRILTTGLLVVSSALFGGLAVALWERKSLEKLRQPNEAPKKPSSSEDGNSE
jgi:hypothetical protein